jgi:hypothetical protein
MHTSLGLRTWLLGKGVGQPATEQLAVLRSFRLFQDLRAAIVSLWPIVVDPLCELPKHMHKLVGRMQPQSLLDPEGVQQGRAVLSLSLIHYYSTSRLESVGCSCTTWYRLQLRDTPPQSLLAAYLDHLLLRVRSLLIVPM